MSSVAERRLRPIYDSLDAGNSKKALQEADKLLKKQPDFHCAKVLRALALLRLDRQEEARKIVDSVVAQLPTDENSLQALTICYKELHETRKICDLYEAVVKKEPNNEEFLSHLFMAYVRVMDYKRQQQTAMALYKAWPKNPYYFWAVMSVLMQAIDGGGDSLLSRTLALQLAERMVQKVLKEQKIQAEAEVQLYLMVLEQQENYEVALDTLNGRLASFLRTPNLIKNKRMLYLQKLKRWHELVLLTRELIRENPSQWQYYETHLDAVFSAAALDGPAQQTDRASNTANCTDLPEQTSSSPGETPNSSDHREQKSNPTELQEQKSNSVDLQDQKCNPAQPQDQRSNHGQDQQDLKSNLTELENQNSNPEGQVDEDSRSPGDRQDQKSDVSEQQDQKSGSSGDCQDLGRLGDTSVSATVSFLTQLRETADRRERAPLLAVLRLCLRLKQNNCTEAMPSDVVCEVLEYVRCYGDRACCFCDLEPVLLLVPDDRVREFLKQCQQMVSTDEDGMPCTMGDLQRHLTWLQLCQHYGGGVPRLERVEELCRYHRGTASFSQRLLDTELRPNDHYLTLAVYNLYEEWQSSGDVVHLLSALTLLNHGLAASPSNFYFKLMAIHIHHLLGASSSALLVYNTLDLKSIQLDTLSYVCSRQVAAQGQLSAAQLVFNTVVKFFLSNIKDTSECLIAAYKVGSFQQIPDFIRLRIRLANSINYRLTLTDRCLLDLTSVSSSHAQTLELMKYTDLGAAALNGVQWDQLQDNRDVTVLPTFSQEQRRGRDAARQLSFRQDLRLLRLRHVQLRALAAATEPRPEPARLRQLADELTQLAQPPAEPAECRLSGPLPSRLGRLLERGYVPLMCTLLEAAAGQLEQPACPADPAVSRLLERCCQLRQQHQPLLESAGRPQQLLEALTLLTETLSWSAVLCGALHQHQQRSRAAAGRRAKKKKPTLQTAEESSDPHCRLVCALLRLTQTSIGLVERAAANLSATCASWRLSQLSVSAGSWPLREASQRTFDQLERSHASATGELLKVLRYKEEYLTGCLL